MKHNKYEDFGADPVEENEDLEKPTHHEKKPKEETDMDMMADDSSIEER